MEQTLFNKLLKQANNGKRADNGFKKEAWTRACAVVEAVTTQLITV
jgi:Myb/SANT-like DNA-binding domain